MTRPLHNVRVYFYRLTWEQMRDRVEREGGVVTDHSAGIRERSRCLLLSQITHQVFCSRTNETLCTRNSPSNSSKSYIRRHGRHVRRRPNIVMARLFETQTQHSDSDALPPGPKLPTVAPGIPNLLLHHASRS